jgi:hypothetical protein
MELARKAKESDFERLTGLPFDCYCDLIIRVALTYLPNNSYTKNWVNKEMDDTYNYVMENIDDYEFISDVVDYMQNYLLKTYGDLQRLSSYGVVTRNGKEQMVIIDYGLSENVFNSYYKKSRE